MRFFSIPADFKKETIDGFHRLNQNYPDSRVIEVYGSVTANNKIGTGRLSNYLGTIDLVDLYDYAGYAADRGIEFNYTLNASHLFNREFSSDGAGEILSFLHKLHEGGIRALTVALPSLMELVQSSGLDFKIKASCICQITSAIKAGAYKKMGAYRIVPDESLNRDFATLKRIQKTFGDGVELIANQICDQNCIYRMFHYNMIAGDPHGAVNEVSANFYEQRCLSQQLRSFDNVLKLSWIRPEDLDYYEAVGIRHFKLQGRHTFKYGGDPVRTAECYFKGSHDGNLMDLLTMFAETTSFKVKIDNKKLDGFIRPFAENDHFCRRDCAVCGYCAGYAKKCMDPAATHELMDLAGGYLQEYDRYRMLLETVNSRLSESETSELSAEFDI